MSESRILLEKAGLHVHGERYLYKHISSLFFALGAILLPSRFFHGTIPHPVKSIVCQNNEKLIALFTNIPKFLQISKKYFGNLLRQGEV